jgi:hypothetical protein
VYIDNANTRMLLCSVFEKRQQFGSETEWAQMTFYTLAEVLPQWLIDFSVVLTWQRRIRRCHSCLWSKADPN